MRYNRTHLRRVANLNVAPIVALQHLIVDIHVPDHAGEHTLGLAHTPHNTKLAPCTRTLGHHRDWSLWLQLLDAVHGALHGLHAALHSESTLAVAPHAMPLAVLLTEEQPLGCLLLLLLLLLVLPQSTTTTTPRAPSCVQMP